MDLGAVLAEPVPAFFAPGNHVRSVAITCTRATSFLTPHQEFHVQQIHKERVEGKLGCPVFGGLRGELGHIDGLVTRGTYILRRVGGLTPLFDAGLGNVVMNVLGQTVLAVGMEAG